RGKALALGSAQPVGGRNGGGSGAGPGRRHDGELPEIPGRGTAERDRAAAAGSCRGRGKGSAGATEAGRQRGRSHAGESLLRADAPGPASVAGTPRPGAPARSARQLASRGRVARPPRLGVVLPPLAPVPEPANPYGEWEQALEAGSDGSPALYRRVARC